MSDATVRKAKGFDPAELRVEIPIRFKERLEHKFDLRRAVWDGNVGCFGPSCPLCSEFFYFCEGCPFYGKFGAERHGCIAWIKRIMYDEKHIEFLIPWTRETYDIAKRQLRKFKNRIRKYDLIKWV